MSMFQAPGSLMNGIRLNNENSSAFREKQHSNTVNKPPTRVALGDLTNSSTIHNPQKGGAAQQKTHVLVQKAPTKATTKKAAYPDIEYVHTSPYADQLPSISYLDDVNMKRIGKPTTAFPAAQLGNRKRPMKAGQSSGSYQIEYLTLFEPISAQSIEDILADDIMDPFSFDLSVQLPELE